MDDELTTLTTPPADRQSEDSLWEIADVAAYLKVKPRTVERRIAEDGLPFKWIGGVRRFIPDQVRQWVRDQAAA